MSKKIKLSCFLILFLACFAEAKPIGSRPSSGGSSFKASPGKTFKPSAGKATSTPSSGWGKTQSGSAAKEQSRQSFVKSQAPKSDYTKKVYDPTTKTTKTQTIKVDPNRGGARVLRQDSYDYRKYSSRPERQKTIVYHKYYGQSYPPAWNGYNDGVSPYFWLYMMNLSSQQQAAYIHNHQNSLDQARINELYAKNAALKAEVDSLKDKPVDENFVPKDMSAEDADLMYDDDYVAAAAGFETSPEVDDGLAWYTWVLIIFLCGLVAFIIYGAM